MPATLTTPASPSDAIDSTSTESLWRAGLAAGVVAAAATTTIAAVASATGVSFESAPGDAIPLSGFAQLTLFFTAVGVVIARLSRTRSHHPRSTFTKITLTLAAASIVPDIVVSFDVASKLSLVLTHAVAAAIVIPPLRARLTDGAH